MDETLGITKTISKPTVDCFSSEAMKKIIQTDATKGDWSIVFKQCSSKTRRRRTCLCSEEKRKR